MFVLGPFRTAHSLIMTVKFGACRRAEIGATTI
jgi:hypothetical protein